MENSWNYVFELLWERCAFIQEPDEEKPIEKPVKKEDISKEKIDAKVKDLIALHKDTVKKQNQVLKVNT